MMEILEKTMITRNSFWPTVIVGGLVILFMIFLLVRMFIKNDPDGTLKVLMPTMMLGMLLIILSTILGCLIRIPTGRYEYRAKLADDFPANELFEKYTNVTYDNGIYTFEDRK